MQQCNVINYNVASSWHFTLFHFIKTLSGGSVFNNDHNNNLK